MIFNFMILLFSQLFLPFMFIIGLYLYESLSIAYLLKSVQSIFFITFIFLIGRWDWVSYYLRYFILLLVPISILITLLQFFFLQNIDLNNYILSEILVDVAITLFFLFFMIRAIAGRKTEEESVICDFPLKNGDYYIAHGGSSKLLNHHYSSIAQKYALDILKINRIGFRCRGIYPEHLDMYYVFKEAIYSPIDGRIVKVVDGFDDLIPPERDTANKAGNHIVILLEENKYIMLAHLLKDSIGVKEGERVTRGQFLGRIGNSGNTTEPHLHIHCIETTEHQYLNHGRSIPMMFDGKFCVRNMLIKK